QSMLGFAYSGGFGVEQDLDKAVEWWTRGRWNGDRLASSYLQVHREKMLAKATWEKEQAEKAKAEGTLGKPKKSE
ncbi:MAG: SEL1-like repeat protein, partial [Alphaproteobacteria bacterium]|nr:SEL1-like repeat protein [Alphaproteobacteria bacterium]